MDILMSETCWAHNKWNKIASDIKLVFHSLTYLKSTGHRLLYGLHTLSNAKLNSSYSLLKLRRNFFPHPSSRTPWNLPTGARGPQIKNSWQRGYIKKNWHKIWKTSVLHLRCRADCPDLWVPSCSNHRLHVRGQYQLNASHAVMQDLALCNFRYGTPLTLPTVRRGHVSTDKPYLLADCYTNPSDISVNTIFLSACR